jgi:hypothetical protein
MVTIGVVFEDLGCLASVEPLVLEGCDEQPLNLGQCAQLRNQDIDISSAITLQGAHQSISKHIHAPGAGILCSLGVYLDLPSSL